MTTEQLEILGHTLGINVYHAKRSKLKRDKVLPKEFYRNRFYASIGHSDMPIIQSLIELGFMTNYNNTDFYYVTDIGINRFCEEFNNYINLN